MNVTHAPAGTESSRNRSSAGSSDSFIASGPLTRHKDRRSAQPAATGCPSTPLFTFLRMAQPARPLTPAPQSARARDRLRVVDEPRVVLRPRPSPAVIRRRRAVALGGLTGLIALPLAILAIGGSPSSQAGRISALLSAGATAPRPLFDPLSPALLAVVAGHDACVAASPKPAPAPRAHDVQVHGSSATAVVTSSD